jgi:hypothetical protein
VKGKKEDEGKKMENPREGYYVAAVSRLMPLQLIQHVNEGLLLFFKKNKMKWLPLKAALNTQVMHNLKVPACAMLTCHNALAHYALLMHNTLAGQDAIRGPANDYGARQALKR